MSNKLWPRFMKRGGAPGDAGYEERMFASPDAVPADEGWEMISPPTGPAPTATAGELARMAQRVAEVTTENARVVGDNLELSTRLGSQAEFLGRMHIYVDELERFATDIAALPDAPKDIVERVQAIIAASPRPAAQPQPVADGDDGKGKGKSGKK